MSECGSYDDEDWYDDEIWPEEPQVTYAEAVYQLKALAAKRTDARIDWQGKRGKQDDARIVFLSQGGEEFRARIRSAGQLGVFTNILGNARLIPERHALWFSEDGSITARLVGDYDEMINVLGALMAPAGKQRRIPVDSGLGRDVLGHLASTGAFIAKEPSAAESTKPRTLLLKVASPELEALYSRRFQSSPSVALELAGFTVASTVAAEEILVDYSTSYLHQIARTAGVSLRLWHRHDRLSRRPQKATKGTIRFPSQLYDQQPAKLYAAASSAGRDPVEKYLKYYQVLEYYMPRAVQHYMTAQGLTSPKQALTPYPTGDANKDRLSIESSQLAAVIDNSTTSAQVAGFLRSKSLVPELSNSQLIVDVPTLSASSLDDRPEISMRVYAIRCRIVHMKEGGGKGGATLLAPFGRESHDLGADLELVRFLAERAIEHWSRPLT